ncbi:MAG TPA: succinate--CoA ligase subunit alpha [Aggregatilineales bacterium]|nr:succinate--CoA ligase subunit alpha [Aggregatilineales bacterium]
MSILVDKSTRVIVQGITGREGSFHARQMIAYGKDHHAPIIVGGVTPGRGGDWFESVPIFDSVREAREATDATTSILYVPPRHAADAIYEAIDGGITLIVCITEGIPIRDTLRVRSRLAGTNTRLVGPNSPGLLTPGAAKVGIIPGRIAMPGNVGVISRSGTLMYEVLHTLTQNRIGQSTCVGIGGDPVVGMSFTEVLALFEDDPQTDQIVLIGEIGGDEEESAAAYIRDHLTKPVVAFIAGKSAPEGRQMGHAGALIEGAFGTHAGKVAALRAANVRLADHPDYIPELLSGR